MSSELHFILVPLFCQGHYIPMFDLARLIASRGVAVTFVTTPINASRIEYSLERLKLKQLPLQLLVLEFPCSAVQLPSGCESFELLPDEQLGLNFFDAMIMLQQPLFRRINEMKPRPNCIIADFCNPWTKQIADQLSIPRLVFHGPCCFYLHCVRKVHEYKLHETVTDDTEAFFVPDIPIQIEVTKPKVVTFFDFPETQRLRESTVEAEATADGLIINSFEELDGEFIERYMNDMNKKAWPIGPVSLGNEEFMDAIHRGNKSLFDTDDLFNWLDSKADDSVIYVSFGTMSKYNYLTLIELGLGLEASNSPFIWVIKDREWSCTEFQQWLKYYDFESKMVSRGLLIKGWSPQTLVLSHRAVGAFMSHCGWNSTVEAIAAGVPIVSWSYFADQFLNAKLVLQVLQIGVELVVEALSYPPSAHAALSRDAVKSALLRVMDRGDEGAKRRRRAKDLATKAMEAMREATGSSYNNLTSMIQYIDAHARSRS